MGTASLVFGLILIGVGLFLIYSGFAVAFQTTGDSDFVVGYFAFSMVLSISAFAIGGLLLRKYDRDKKKEKNS